MIPAPRFPRFFLGISCRSEQDAIPMLFKGVEVLRS